MPAHDPTAGADRSDRGAREQDLAVTIRHGEEEDAAALHRVAAGPRAVWGTMQLPLQSRRLWEQRLADPPAGLRLLVACVGDDQEVVGNLALIPVQRPRRQHVASLGMAVRDDLQGRGVGTALLAAAMDLADNWMQLTRVELEVYPDNEPAVRLYHSFGFEVEGVQRKAVFRDGDHVDIQLMARLHPRLTGGRPGTDAESKGDQ